MALRQNPDGTFEWYDDGIVGGNGITVTTTPVPNYYIPTEPISSTYIAPPEETNLLVITNMLKSKGVPDVTINGHSISGLIQAHAVTCVDALRRGTVAHIQKLEAEKTKLREKLLLSGESTDPISGRKFREEE